MKTKLRRPVSLSITEQESEILDILREKNINPIMIFRRGLSIYESELLNND